jgi:hypothetical protein
MDFDQDEGTDMGFDIPETIKETQDVIQRDAGNLRVFAWHMEGITVSNSYL